ncbi:MAG: hypoxanthine phosphoribosyltransferase, partial [Planctomycetes bacterium]|nr:hypoxanthine phosphoribosyltransferase [Planctomycetota bacterium]
MSAEVECLIDARRLATRVAELGREISDDYAAVDTPIVVGVLTGAWVFM